MIKELIGRGQQLDAVHFTYEVGLVNKFPPVPLLKAFLKDARKAAASILEDPNNPGRAAVHILFTCLVSFSQTSFTWVKAYCCICDGLPDFSLAVHD